MKLLGSVLIIMVASASANASPLPFSEAFDVLNNGTLDAQNGWAVQGGSATVQTNIVQSGKAVELIGTSVSHEFASSNATVWLTFWARCEDVAEQNPVVTDPAISVAFYINTNQNVVVYSNTAPVTLSTVIPTNVWIRFDVYCDYDSLTWNLSVNKTNVAAGLPLYSNSRQLASVQIQNASASSVYVDTLTIVDHEPVADIIDADGDTIPDWWEQKYFGGITNADANVTNRNAYIAGLSPDERFEILGYPLSWDGHPGRRYSVYATTNLLSGFTPLQTNILWSEDQYTDLINTNEQSMFYRVEVGLDN